MDLRAQRRRTQVLDRFIVPSDIQMEWFDRHWALMMCTPGLGQSLQYLTTTFTSLILAFYWGPLLTLAILSALPILIIFQDFSQAVAGPRLTHERNLPCTCSILYHVQPLTLEHNAQSHKSSLLARVPAALRALSVTWDATAGESQFVTMTMFV